ncbi:MAG TPA: hypothetical protein VNU28_03160 [Solirubrobacteraceae bacterium]|nr:hypothetical protein [Solirubrobacteraceae bacterium]
MARVLIVEGADRGLRLAEALLADGHAVRATTSDSARAGAIEAVGGESRLGTPERLATLRGSLDHVTVACWLLADVKDPELACALHGPRLERFLSDAIDSTLRGFVYEAGGKAVPAEVLAVGKRIVSETARLNSIPTALLTADPLDPDVWLAQALVAIGDLLEGRRIGS